MVNHGSGRQGHTSFPLCSLLSSPSFSAVQVTSLHRLALLFMGKLALQVLTTSLWFSNSPHHRFYIWPDSTGCLFHHIVICQSILSTSVFYFKNSFRLYWWEKTEADNVAILWIHGGIWIDTAGCGSFHEHRGHLLQDLVKSSHAFTGRSILLYMGKKPLEHAILTSLVTELPE